MRSWIVPLTRRCILVGLAAGVGARGAQGQVAKEKTTIPHPKPFFIQGDSTKPTVVISPASGTFAATVAVTIAYGDHCELPNPPTITLNGQNVTSQFTYTGGGGGTQCTGVTGQATGTIALRPGADTLVSWISNANALSDTARAYYTSVLPVHKLHISVAAGAMHAAPNSVATLSWTVTNLGNTTDSVNVKHLCYPTWVLSDCYSIPDSIQGLAPGGTWSGTAHISISDSVGQLGRLRTIAFERTHSEATDTTYTDITVQNPLGPGVVLSTVTPDVTHPRDKCVTIEIRPGIAYECGDLRVVHALPTTQTYNKARTPALIYNSNMATGVNAIGALLTFDPAKGTPDTVKVTVTDSATGNIVGSRQWLGLYWVNGATQRVTVRLDGELGLENLGTRYVYTFTAQAIYNAAHTTQSFSATGAQLATSVANGPAFENMLAGQEYLIIPQWTGATPWNSTKPLFWANSEGDTRQYNAVPNDSLVWAAAGVDRPDTIKSFNGPTLYGLYRYAEHGAVVHFDPHGPELEVIDRLGHSTRLVDTTITGAPYSTSVDIPAPNGGGLPYVFMHDSWKARLDSIVAPSVSGQSRTVHFRYDTLNLYADTIKDPDGSFEVYAFANGQPHLPLDNLMTSYQDKRGTIIRFYYDSAFKLSKVTIDSGSKIVVSPAVPSLNITWTFQPAESRGLTTPVAPDSAYTLVVGPRGNQSCSPPLPPCPDSLDATRFWIDQWGEPTRIRDAHGEEIELTRANARYPSLVTYARYQNGRVTVATYDSRGNDSTLTDSSFSISGTYPTTHYTFDQKWDYVTKIQRPAGDSVMFAYDANTGNRLWQQPGQDTIRRVHFGYWTTTPWVGLLQSIHTPAESLSTTVSYDHALANDSGTVTPLGIFSYVSRDAIGRVTGTHTPIDATNWLTDSSQYDAMDRVTFSSSHAPALTHNYVSDTAMLRFHPFHQPFTADSQALTITTTFDSAGNPTSIVRQSLPDPASIGTMRTDLVYDRDDRAIQKIQYFANDSTASDYTFYDDAGNVTGGITRRLDTISVAFDALNRTIRRILPAKEYPRDTNPGFLGYGWTLPQYSNCPDNTGYCIPADTATFTYDRVGRVTTANNGDAHITRAYDQRGDLIVDTLRTRAFTNTDFTQHVYGLSFTYDLDGRRLTLTHPSTIAPKNSSGVLLNQNTYIYDLSGIGELTDVTDIFGNVFDYQYDIDGRVFHLNRSGGSVLEHWTYDADSRLVERIDSTPNVSPTNGWQYNVLHDDVYQYDSRGKVVQVNMNAPGEQIVVLNSYAGLGSLVDGLIRPLSDVGSGTDNRDEEYTRTDAFGNAWARWRDSWSYGAYGDSVHTQLGTTYEQGSGRMLEDSTFATGTQIFMNSTARVYDLSGNMIRVGGFRFTNVTGSNAVTTGSDQYWDADQHLRAVDKHECFYGGDTTCQHVAFSVSDLPYMQQYRYDALGRRILTATLPTPSCAGNTKAPACEGFIERTVYDGDQVLYEIRMPDSVGIVATDLERDTGAVAGYELPGGLQSEVIDPQYGRAIYTHGLGVDDPLDIVRVGYDTLFPGPQQIIPVPDWRGGYDAGTFALGARYQCSQHPDSVAYITNPALCFVVQYQDPQYGVFHQDLFFNQFNQTVPLWNGSLIADRRDPTNFIYLRNRYYDPQTGRFLQEDPIGLAGGLNAYGFAGGDPVNYSDPFGLCPPEMRGNCTQSEAHGPHRPPTADQEALQDPGFADPVALATGALAGPLDAAIANAAERLAADAAGGSVVKEGIYEFTAKSGKTYVGQSSDITRRLGQHVRTGKVTQAAADAAQRTEVLGGKTAREVAEQMRINQLGGIKNLENKVNPIGPARSGLLPPP
jgi:RHS repeat-associated protein